MFGVTAMTCVRMNAMAGAATSAKAAGYSMPLESEPHERTFMQWPAHTRLYGTERMLEDVRSRIVSMAKAISAFEPVVVLARPEQLEAARAALGQGIDIWPIETDDLWCRDSGPTFVRSADGTLAVSDFNFNGWGGKQEHVSDGVIARRVAKKLGLTVYDSGIIGEGGGIEHDGAGTVLAHESCWINTNRNAGGKADIERGILEALGAEKMIWAPGLKGADITDYHIDAVARFVKPGQVLIQLSKTIDRSDPWSVAAYQTYDILKAARDAQGRKLDIVVVTDPGRIRSKSDDFVSSYVNYYVCNGGVVGAQFGDDKADDAARSLLQQLYPGRKVVSLDIDPICEAGGGIHCSTQQQPKAKA
jgi:agmatine deiminase